jgi:PAS domain-containing protein
MTNGSADPRATHSWTGPQQPVEIILLRQVASYLDMPVFIVDRDGQLLYYNEPAEPLLGARYDEVGPMTVQQWLAAFKPSRPDGGHLSEDRVPLLIALRRQRPVHRVLAITGVDGVRRTIGATCLPLKGQGGQLLGAIAIFWPESRR